MRAGPQRQVNQAHTVGFATINKPDRYGRLHQCGGARGHRLPGLGNDATIRPQHSDVRHIRRCPQRGHHTGNGNVVDVKKWAGNGLAEHMHNFISPFYRPGVCLAAQCHHVVRRVKRRDQDHHAQHPAIQAVTHVTPPPGQPALFSDFDRHGWRSRHRHHGLRPAQPSRTSFWYSGERRTTAMSCHSLAATAGASCTNWCDNIRKYGF